MMKSSRLFLLAQPFLQRPLSFNFQRLDRIERSEKAAKAAWVLSRPLYRFRLFDLKQIPGPKRRAAIELQVRQWCPYENGAHTIAWQKDCALVWCWDKARIAEQMLAAQLDSAKTAVIPETALHPLPESGLRLAACLDGVEGQYWQDGMLAHSRWWPQKPSEGEWAMFQRDIGREASFPVPEPAAMQFLDQPWAALTSAEGYVDLQLRIERLSYLIAFFCLVLPTFWYGFAMLKSEKAIRSLHEEYSASERKINPLLEARNQAITAYSRIQSLTGLNQYPDQLYLMAKVAEVLPGNGASLSEWDFQNGKLRLVFSSEKEPLSASFLINALQLAGPFKNVSTLPGSDAKSVSLQMDIAANHV